MKNFLNTIKKFVTTTVGRTSKTAFSALDTKH